MEYAYAVLLLSESGEELNEQNLRAVLEAANCSVSESRVKALVAALEGVEVDSIGPGTVPSVVAGDEPGEGDDPGPGAGGPGRAATGETAETDGGSPGDHADAAADPEPGAGGDESG